MKYEAIQVKHRPYNSAVQHEDDGIVVYTRHFEDAIKIAAALNVVDVMRATERHDEAAEEAVEIILLADKEIERRCVVNDETGLTEEEEQRATEVES